MAQTDNNPSGKETNEKRNLHPKELRFFAKKFVDCEKVSFHDNQILRDFYLFLLVFNLMTERGRHHEWSGATDVTHLRLVVSIRRTESGRIPRRTSAQDKNKKILAHPNPESASARLLNFDVFPVNNIQHSYAFLDMLCRTSAVLITSRNTKE